MKISGDTTQSDFFHDIFPKVELMMIQTDDFNNKPPTNFVKYVLFFGVESGGAIDCPIMCSQV